MSDAETAESPWEVVHPPGAAQAVGYSNGILSGEGRRLSVAGQIDMGPDGRVVHPGDIAAQAAGAFANVVGVVTSAGGKPGHIVRMRIFVADVSRYKANAKEIGTSYRKYFGSWFPAMSLVQVAGFYDEHALIEVEAEAIIP